jgi:hypothetical protein
LDVDPLSLKIEFRVLHPARSLQLLAGSLNVKYFSKPYREMEPKPASKLSENATAARPSRKIVGFHLDDGGDWVAELECGHTQHVRHNPPWQSRPWVTTAEGRTSRVGTELACAKCVDR